MMTLLFSEEEIRFLHALMWSSDPSKCRNLAKHYNVSDTDLERHLVNCLDGVDTED